MSFWDHDIEPPKVSFPDIPIPTELDEYLFDLRGYVIITGALSQTEVGACDDAIATIPRETPPGGWAGYVYRRDIPIHRGIYYDQIYEAGEGFEKLIDHPSYINYVLRFVGGGSFDFHHGPLFIDDAIYIIRGPGEAVRPHSGAHDRCKRIQYRYHNGQFFCGQVNVLIAHTDIGPGDGGTMIIPGSHKSNIIHPGHPFRAGQKVDGGDPDDMAGSLDDMPGAVEVHMKAGDALVFVDACCHGSAKRTNPGERRVSIYRYGSAWNRSAGGFEPSAALLERLNPYARSVVHPEQNVNRRPPLVDA